MPDFNQLQQMRQGSSTGALGQLADGDLNQLRQIIQAMQSQRKRLSPEQIHNLGSLYGAPLSQARIKFFEDRLNRDPNQSYYGKFPEFPD